MSPIDEDVETIKERKKRSSFQEEGGLTHSLTGNKHKQKKTDGRF